MTQMLKTTFFYNLPTLEGEITYQRIQSILNAAREDRIQEEWKDRKQECVHTRVWVCILQADKALPGASWVDWSGGENG